MSVDDIETLRQPYEHYAFAQSIGASVLSAPNIFENLRNDDLEISYSNWYVSNSILTQHDDNYYVTHGFEADPYGFPIIRRGLPAISKDGQQYRLESDLIGRKTQLVAEDISQMTDIATFLGVSAESVTHVVTTMMKTRNWSYFWGANPITDAAFTVAHVPQELRTTAFDDVTRSRPLPPNILEDARAAKHFPVILGGYEWDSSFGFGICSLIKGYNQRSLYETNTRAN
jgi:hypothetical protein